VSSRLMMVCSMRELMAGWLPEALTWYLTAATEP
jgi:hypothetical protein